MLTKRNALAFVICLACFGCARTTMPPQNLTGLWHQVESRDTAATVAKRYGSSETLLVEVNDLPRSGSLSGRDEIFVPKKGGRRPGTGAEPPKPLAYASTSKARPSSSTDRGGVKQTGRCVDGDSCLIWPADGKVNTTFGKSAGGHHDGLDISGAKGSPVRAAENGKVLYSGDEIKGYGNLVIISHGRNLITVYAHNDENLVKEGDLVKKGQTIGRMGSTGSASTSHLHFEVRDREQPADPLNYLPRK